MLDHELWDKERKIDNEAKRMMQAFKDGIAAKVKKESNH